MKPQTAKVLNYMMFEPNGITPLSALSNCGTFRLSERIREIMAEGFRVEKGWFETYKGARVRRYYLTNPRAEARRFRRICSGRKS
ncbi:MAG: hypothetical protein M0R80_26200 [Proteobacteria bacterium]|jgi:hypothetical protein|nr:hypothetical protein [Pseudomonadota bacterium]